MCSSDLLLAGGVARRLTTAEGIGLGATATALRVAYGDRAQVTANGRSGGPEFTVRTGARAALTGYLTAAGAEGEVTMLAAGGSCAD